MKLSQKVVMSVLLSVILLSFVPGSYLHEEWGMGSIVGILQSVTFMLTFIPIGLVVCAILSGYYLTQYTLLRSPRLITGYYCLIGGIAFVIPTLRYHVHTDSISKRVEFPSVGILLAFGSVVLVTSIMGGWCGRLQLQHPDKHLGKAMLTILLIGCIGFSFTWTGGGLLLSGLGMTYYSETFRLQIDAHPRINLLRCGVTLHLPFHKELVSLIMGDPYFYRPDRGRMGIQAGWLCT